MTAKSADGPRLLGAALAGGGSRRFGTNKALVSLGGKTLVGRATELLAPHVAHVVVVGGNSADPGFSGVEMIPDRAPGLGPLGGLATALRAAEERALDGVFVLACDTPLIPTDLLEELVGLWDGRSALLPESRGPLGLEPLCGVYPVAMGPLVAEATTAVDRSMAALVHSLPVRRLSLFRVRAYGDPEDLFLNVNRPQDLERARVLLVGGERG